RAIMTALEPDRNRRWADVMSFARALRDAVAQAPDVDAPGPRARHASRTSLPSQGSAPSQDSFSSHGPAPSPAPARGSWAGTPSQPSSYPTPPPPRPGSPLPPGPPLPP